MMEEFTNNTNKALLWNILYEQKFFNNIPDTHVKEIQYIFDREISNISQSNSKSGTSLMQLNKNAIQVISSRIQAYKEENSNFHNKEKEMQNSLSRKQAEFDALMNKATPDVPDFTDQKDEPFDTSNMANLLNRMISSREQQLKQVLTIESDKNPNNQENKIEEKEEKVIEDKRQMKNVIQEQTDVSSTPILRIGSNLSLADENIMDISRTQRTSGTARITSNIDIPGAINNDTKMERNVSFTDDNKPDKFLQNLKRFNSNKHLNEEFIGEQKFNKQSKLDAISNQLTALMEKVSSIERTIERRDSMGSRSSFGSFSLSPPN
jgi:hypothetical protein